MNKNLEYFYHYTSIETLSLILKNKKIRFTRADLVNDLEELHITDKPEIKKSAFISCWTICDCESIPMWNLYANQSKGVRIKLRNPIFKNGKTPSYVPKHDCNILPLLNFSNTISKENEHELIKYLIGPIEVTYQNSIENKILSHDGELIIKNIGTIKSKYWMFEKEYRFLALANHDWNFQDEKFELKNPPDYSTVKDEFIDIEIDDTIFNNIEVTLGPNCHDPERIIVQCLLKNFTSNGKILPSSLYGKIKHR